MTLTSSQDSSRPHPVPKSPSLSPSTSRNNNAIDPLALNDKSAATTSSSIDNRVLHHATSTSELPNDSGPKGISESLLSQLLNRQSEDYRDIVFEIPDHPDHARSTKKNYQKRVSFDTINLKYDDDRDDLGEYDDDEFPYRRSSNIIDEYNFSGSGCGVQSLSTRGRARSPDIYSRSPLASPNTSPSRRGLSPLRSGNDVSRLLAGSFRTDYPTRPIITHHGCTFTKVHKKFEDLYLGKLNNSDHGHLTPVLPHRVILVYISGRKHTWVALDWILNKFIENGDSVIVVAAINQNFNSRRKLSSSFSSPQRVVAKTLKVRLRQRNRPEFIKHIAKNIMTYMMEVINKDVIAKVSIEIAEGKTRSVLKEMYKLYEPNLVCTGTKQSSRISAPLKSWLSSKLTDRLVKNFPLPVIVVPAMNMIEFENGLKNDIDKKYNGSMEVSDSVASSADSSGSSGSRTWSIYTGKSLSNVNTVDSDDQRRSEWSYDDRRASRGSNSLRSVDSNEMGTPNADNASINSDSSVESVGSDESYSSFDEITKVFRTYKLEIDNELNNCINQPMGDRFFSNFLVAISDKSAELCQELKSIDPDFRGKGAKLARAITGSNSFGRVPYKTKSLLQPIEPALTAPSSGLSYKEMKRNLKLNAQRSSQAVNLSTPSFTIEGASPVNVKPPVTFEDSAPRKTSLKFVDSVPPSKENSPTPANEPSFKPRLGSRLKSKTLSKSLSYDMDLPSPRPHLEPLKSHPDITAVLSNGASGSDSDREKDKRKKKGRFWKLFK